jgi:nitrite reductase/ring-hydroxylating ferredoxin subunit
VTVTEARASERRPPAPAGRIDRARYTSQQFFDVEVERLWTRTWQLACLDSDIPNVGDYYEYEIGPYSVLVVRTGTDEVRAYQNVCMHRGRKIKCGQGTSDRLRCPYHSWTWNLDGTLRSVPERETFCAFEDDDVRLHDVRVDSWNHWIFVNLDPDAVPLAEYLGDMPALLEPYRYDRQYKWWSRSTVVGANWKNTIDAFNEAYHARSIHPESVPFINYADYEVQLVGDHSCMIVPFGVPDSVALTTPPALDEMLDAMEWSFAAFGEDTALVDALRQMPPGPDQQLRDVMVPLLRGAMAQSNIDVDALSDSQLIDDWHFFIFPNIVINCFSFGYWLFRIRPRDVDSVSFDMWYFHRVPDEMPLPDPDPNQFIPEGESCGPVMDQDFRNLPVQQAGMHNPTYPGVLLSSLESRIAHMHDVLDRYLDQ